ncbi:hypothetical protein ACFSX9_08105 [Flavobacterium ardleyense]|uniref:Lipoprotein n=1 Tax=Flavobacterium ardleyense TaxID=2038737 RepID=A0ABW5Z772_9FLAO
MKKKIYYAFIVLLVLAIFAFDQYYERKRKSEIESYTEASVAFSREIISGGKGTSGLKFYFYLNGKLIVGRQYSSDRYHNSLLDKFYLVKYDKNDPIKNYIYLNEEIQADSTILSKAGFKYITYYDYDILTSSYVKKYKWE